MSESDNTKQNLARLALRKYALKGFSQNNLVRVLIMMPDKLHTDYKFLKRDLAQDIQVIQNLVANADTLYVDLWTDSELKELHCYLTEDEYNRKIERLQSDEDNEILEQVMELIANLPEGKSEKQHKLLDPELINIFEMLDLIKLRISGYTGSA